ncbi:MAG TPA: hypothetical protein VKE42_04515, partial [Candidatus Cybelea sp.]|nr:hypothetical protein [Candidatus Cybelea sp.]
DDADELSNAITEISKCERGEWIEITADELQRLYDLFDAGRKIYERDDLYRTGKTRRGTEFRELKRSVVSEKLALLLAAIPTTTPSNPKGFVAQLLEFVIAENPRFSALEAAYRKLIKSKKFISIAEVIEELTTQTNRWRFCLSLQPNATQSRHDIEYWKKRIVELEAAYRAQQAKEAEQQRKEAEAKRQQQEREERNRIQWQMHNMRERAEREAKVRERAEEEIQRATRRMQSKISSRILWRYFQLLMFSHGIFLSYETLSEMWWEEANKRRDAFFAARKAID